jgi:hypothetical protein
MNSSVPHDPRTRIMGSGRPHLARTAREVRPFAVRELEEETGLRLLPSTMAALREVKVFDHLIAASRAG